MSRLRDLADELLLEERALVDERDAALRRAEDAEARVATLERRLAHFEYRPEREPETVEERALAAVLHRLGDVPILKRRAEVLHAGRESVSGIPTAHVVVTTVVSVNVPIPSPVVRPDPR